MQEFKKQIPRKIFVKNTTVLEQTTYSNLNKHLNFDGCTSCWGQEIFLVYFLYVVFIGKLLEFNEYYLFCATNWFYVVTVHDRYRLKLNLTCVNQANNKFLIENKYCKINITFTLILKVVCCDFWRPYICNIFAELNSDRDLTVHHHGIKESFCYHFHGIRSKSWLLTWYSSLLFKCDKHKATW